MFVGILKRFLITLSCPQLQVRVEVSHHQKTSDGDFKKVKSLAFLLDEPKELSEAPKKGKKLKKGTTALTSKNFGSIVNISKLKSAPSTVTAWRCRLLACSELDWIVSIQLKLSVRARWNHVPNHVGIMLRNYRGRSN